MSSDLEIIKQLEKKLNIKFEARFNDEKEMGWGKPYAQYELNASEQVIKLCLRHQKLQKVLLEIAQLVNLQLLDLRNNRLKNWPVEMAQLINLQLLDLSSNELTNWPVEMAQLVNLKWLDLSTNLLTNWPVEMAHLVNLQQLDLSYNGLTKPVEMAQLVNLKWLNLRNNRLKNWPVEMAQLVKLQQLDLSTNLLTNWPVEMAQLVNLKQLNLINNNLTNYLVEIAQLVNLQQLNLINNNLTSWPVEMAQLVNLQQLDLRDNNLTNWPVEMVQLVNLQQLNLRNNKLTNWPVEMAQLVNLQQLDLSYNELTNWPVEMVHLVNLQQLDLSFNKLTNWPVEMVHLVSLQRLDLCSNKLTNWPVEMAHLGIETYLGWKPKNGIFLAINPLENPPPEIIKQGNSAIIEYLQAGEKQRLNEARVLFVGDGGAGKTSLIKHLLGQKFNPNESQTKGININDWEIVDIKHCEIGDEKIKTHLWDFGGQEVMHATHQFFLSKRSLYILVLDGRKDEKTEYWLKYIESFGGKSPILIVLNKIDQNPSFELNRKFLTEKYKNIQGFKRLSCSEGEGIAEFKLAFQQALTKIEIRQMDWPITWFKVKTALEQMSDHYIDYNKFITICQTNNVTEKSAQNVLVEYLNNLGIILHFTDFRLKNTHVLEPKWVTQAVYKIINARQVTDQQGILHFNDLENILKQESTEDYYYPSDQHPYIIDLMKKFELCYELEDNQVLIPDLLPVEEPNFDFEPNLQFRIDYNFLPRSIMPRFIVNMHHDIKDQLRWRTGVVLQDQEFAATAVIKSDDDDRRIFISVNGKQRRDYFAVILKTLIKIHNSFEVDKLGIDERVCLPDNSNVTVNLQHLYKLEHIGQNEYFPEGADKAYSVQELLGTVGIKDKEILRYVKEIHANNQETNTEKTTDTILLQPNIFGIGFNLNSLFKWFLQFHRQKNDKK